MAQYKSTKVRIDAMIEQKQRDYLDRVCKSRHISMGELLRLIIQERMKNPTYTGNKGDDEEE